MRLPALAETLRRLGRDGASSFYEGRLARDIAADLADCGSPVALADLAAFRAERRKPLHVRVSQAELYNFPPPTQGLASLMILALFDRLGVSEDEGFAHVHGLVEATKLAFLTRDAVVGCPSAMRENAEAFLTNTVLNALAEKIDIEHALPWPRPTEPGDTVWLGAIDSNGLAVSFIQSIFFEYGSGCVLGNTGIVWQNRGASFVLSGDGPRLLARGRKPFHTLNPAMAFFDDGRRMVYGTMGGEGQPQTQAAVFSRYGFFGQGLQAAVTGPRWLLGKTWGENSITLKLENRFPPELIAALQKAGHDIEILPEFTSTMGHAGAIVRRPDGVFEGAADPRSDGAAVGF
jgi:gamma-glutamyltranspeptidase/glutathione hydrolase